MRSSVNPSHPPCPRAETETRPPGPRSSGPAPPHCAQAHHTDCRRAKQVSAYGITRKKLSRATASTAIETRAWANTDRHKSRNCMASSHLWSPAHRTHVGLRQSQTPNGAPEASVTKPARLYLATNLDVAQAFPPSQLRKRHGPISFRTPFAPHTTRSHVIQGSIHGMSKKDPSRHERPSARNDNHEHTVRQRLEAANSLPKSTPTKNTHDCLIPKTFSQIFFNEFQFAETHETAVPAGVDRATATIAMTMAIRLAATTIP